MKTCNPTHRTPNSTTYSSLGPPISIASASPMMPRSAESWIVLAISRSPTAAVQQPGWIVAADIAGKPVPRRPPDPGADLLDHDHQRKDQRHQPAQPIAELRSRLGIRRDGGRIVVGSAADQAGAEDAEETGFARFDDGVKRKPLIENSFVQRSQLVSFFDIRTTTQQACAATVAPMPILFFSLSPWPVRSQISTCPPSSTTRSNGRQKNSSGLAELRNIQANSFSRQIGMPGLALGITVLRLRKYETVAGS